MWKNTAVSHRLKLDAPVIQGPFGGGLSSVDLVVAVSENGGLGSFGVHHLDAAGIRDVAAKIRARTSRPFALNLWIPLRDSDDPRLYRRSNGARRWSCCSLTTGNLGVPLPARPARFAPRYEEQIETVLELAAGRCSASCSVCRRPRVLDRCRSAGIVTLGAATTPDEAKLLADAGVDMIVATGFEAGGHRVSFLRDRRGMPHRHAGAGSAGRRRGEGAGDRGRRHRRWARCRGGPGARRVGGADRHGFPGLRGIECRARCIGRCCSATPRAARH